VNSPRPSLPVRIVDRKTETTLTRTFLFTGGVSVFGGRLRPDGGRQRRAKELQIDVALLKPASGSSISEEDSALTAAGLEEFATLRVELVEHIERLLGAADQLAAATEQRREQARSAGGGNPLYELGVEAESIVRRERGDDPRVEPMTGNDELVVLATDTVAGVAAATLTVLLSRRRPVYLVASNSEPGEPQVVHDPIDVRNRGWPIGRIIIPSGLSPHTVRQIEDAAAALARSLRCASLLCQGEALIIEVSGGYKAVIPLVLQIAEYLASIPADTLSSDVSVWLRHEEEPDRWMRARLRAFDPATLNAHFHVLDDIDRGAVRPDRVLEGYGWERDGNGASLTSIGRGALTLLRAHGFPHY
jgi:hypothetical protein